MTVAMPARVSGVRPWCRERYPGAFFPACRTIEEKQK